MKSFKERALTMPALLMRIVLTLLFFAALGSGLVTYRNLLDLSETYTAADAEMRRFMLYGPLAPLVAQAEVRLPPQSRLLLISDADPALIAYGLFPRRIWQTTVDQALQPMFRDQSSSPYLARPPDSFAVDWVISLTAENFARGGDFLPVKRGE